MSTPHPFPYQGSKRSIAGQILQYIPSDTICLIEPFCGSAAVSIATAQQGLAKRFLLNDINRPLMDLWDWMLSRPRDLVAGYEELWNQQHTDKKEFFLQIRKEFNASAQPCHLLYLLARIVKGSVRYNSQGSFNQSPDNRRSGMRPRNMRQQILGVSTLLGGITTLSALDFRNIITRATIDDLIYMDPPYQGTSFSRDHRYYSGLRYDEFVDALSGLNEKKGLIHHKL